MVKLETEILREIERQLYIKNGLAFIDMYSNNTAFRRIIEINYNTEQVTILVERILEELIGDT